MGAINDQVRKIAMCENLLKRNTCRFCLYIRHLSSSTYELLRNTGVMKLPSQRTQRDYTYYTCSDIGFSSSVDQQLMEAANVVSCPERDKYIIIILDEMHIRENLVYDKHTGIVHSNMHLNNINLQNRSYCWIC